MNNLNKYPVLIPRKLRRKTVNSKISREIFFIDCVNDLAACARSGSTYHLLRSSVLLRTLLVDEGGWLSELANEYDVSLKFQVSSQDIGGEHQTIPRSDREFYDKLSEFRSRVASYHSVKLIKEPKEVLNLEKFRKKVCLIIRGSEDHCFSVQEIIRLLAHKHGGAHINRAFDASELEAFHHDEFNPFSINGGSFYTEKAKEIIMVVLESIFPLVLKVQQNLVLHDRKYMQHKHTQTVRVMSKEEYEELQRKKEP